MLHRNTKNSDATQSDLVVEDLADQINVFVFKIDIHLVMNI